MAFSLTHLIAIACGGALGACLRFLVGLGVVRWVGDAFPAGTLLVNVAGSFAMGLCAAWLMQRGPGDIGRLFLLTGVLGGFTTFSAFSLEVLTLWQRGSNGAALLYIGLSFVGSLLAVYLGFRLARG